MKKRFKLLFILLFLAAIIGYTGTYFIAPHTIIMKHTISQKIDYNLYNFNSEKVNIMVEDSIELDAYLITPKLDSIKGIIIMVHGIGSCKEPFVELAQDLANQKIATFLFDLRAHGKSGGEYCTYGYYEKNDIAQIVSFIESKYPNIPVGIWGTSLGGAIAIQALEKDKRIQFGIVECTFTELDKIVYDYQKRICFGLGFKFITDESLAKAGKIAGFNPEEVKPINSVKQITQPMFMAHGKQDKNIAFQYGKQLFDNLKSEEKTFVGLENMGHSYFYFSAGIEYRNKVMGFIERQMQQ